MSQETLKTFGIDEIREPESEVPQQAVLSEVGEEFLGDDEELEAYAHRNGFETFADMLVKARQIVQAGAPLSFTGAPTGFQERVFMKRFKE